MTVQSGRLAYRGKLLPGFIVTAIFTAFEVKANHVQMTYYYLFIIAFLVIAFLVEAIRRKQLKTFLKATAVCVAGAAIGISINLSNLYHTWQYQKESMRGKTELNKGNTADQTDSGLGREYITQWSYGTGETWTLLIPNTKGGASVPLAQNKTAMEKELRQLRALLDGEKIDGRGAREFYTGSIGGNEVVIEQCGIGKVNSAVGAAEMIAGFAPELVISTGVAGGVSTAIASGKCPSMSRIFSFESTNQSPVTVSPACMRGSPCPKELSARALSIKSVGAA